MSRMITWVDDDVENKIQGFYWLEFADKRRKVNVKNMTCLILLILKSEEVI